MRKLLLPVVTGNAVGAGNVTCGGAMRGGGGGVKEVPAVMGTVCKSDVDMRSDTAKPKTRKQQQETQKNKTTGDGEIERETDTTKDQQTEQEQVDFDCFRE